MWGGGSRCPKARPRHAHVLAVSPQQGPGRLPNTNEAARPAQSGGYRSGKQVSAPTLLLQEVTRKLVQLPMPSSTCQCICGWHAVPAGRWRRAAGEPGAPLGRN